MSTLRAAAWHLSRISSRRSTRAGVVDEAMLERLVGDLIAAGVNGVTPLGSTGEIMYLTPAQRRAIVGATLRVAKGRVPVVPGVAAFATTDAVDQAREFAALGVDGLVVMRQNAFPASEEGVVDYFTQVARAVDVPIVLYTNPTLLGSDFSIDTLDRACARAEHPLHQRRDRRYGPHLDADQPLGRHARSVQRVGAHPGLRLHAGRRRLDGRPGVRHTASRGRALPPRHLPAIVQGALALQRPLWGINECFRKYPLAACIKAALQLRGYAVGEPIPPQRSLGPAARDEIAAALADADRAMAEAVSAMDTIETDAVRELRARAGRRTRCARRSTEIVRFLRDNSWLSPVLKRPRRRARIRRCGSRRAWRWSRRPTKPTSCVWPRSRRAGVLPLTPRGAGTSNFGLLTPAEGGVIVDLRGSPVAAIIAGDGARATAGTLQGASRARRAPPAASCR